MSATGNAPMTSMHAVLSMPYQLTPGAAAGTFLAELAGQRIVGSRVGDGPVIVPAQDVDTAGAATESYVVVSSSGSVTGFTATPDGVFATIRLDGADTDMLHRLLDTTVDAVSVGARVTARWAPEPKGWMTDLEGFVLAPSDISTAAPAPLTDAREALGEREYSMELHYDHAYGAYYGRLFDELATSRRIVGSRCPQCSSVLVPPRELCDLCNIPTGEFIDLPDTGVLNAFSIIGLKIQGQRREPPYIYAEVILDGSDTRLIHVIECDDVEKVKAHLAPGARVKAVWRDAEPTGTLADIDCFALVDPL